MQLLTRIERMEVEDWRRRLHGSESTLCEMTTKLNIITSVATHQCPREPHHHLRLLHKRWAVEQPHFVRNFDHHDLECMHNHAKVPNRKLSCESRRHPPRGCEGRWGSPELHLDGCALCHYSPVRRDDRGGDPVRRRRRGVVAAASLQPNRGTPNRERVDFEARRRGFKLRTSPARNLRQLPG